MYTAFLRLIELVIANHVFKIPWNVIFVNLKRKYIFKLPLPLSRFYQTSGF
ncbi:hypothetical protein OBV_12810 [Oscillibacter valericigenes Sjm18-20]|nr:hypothetical protein OBV_12810 [Oscillibacter valericigenes Sjm18-20]